MCTFCLRCELFVRLKIRTKTSDVTIAFILLHAAGSSTQNGGSVAQRQFCRVRQNCRARNRSAEVVKQLADRDAGDFVRFVMSPIMTAFLLADEASASAR